MAGLCAARAANALIAVPKFGTEREDGHTDFKLGPKGIRVHAISPGPLATRAASGIPEFNSLLEKAQGKAPSRKLVSIMDVGLAVAFLAHDAAKLAGAIGAQHERARRWTTACAQQRFTTSRPHSRRSG